MDFKTFLHITSKLIMAKQTLFALPFALIGVLFAGGGSFATWFLVIIALIAARTAGMSFNRVIDATIDGKNPRTKDRVLPAGELKASTVWILAVISSLILIFSSYMLNELCFKLSFLAVFLLISYSYFKRFSSSSHFYLGLVEAAAPMGGYIAVTGELNFMPFLLGFIILSWIAGLDIVYAFQDINFDKKENLHSLPVKIGEKKALICSLMCYGMSTAAMVIAGIISNMGIIYWIAIIIIVLLFSYQQIMARQQDINESIKKMFHANMYISPALFFGILLDIWQGHL